MKPFKTLARWLPHRTSTPARADAPGRGRDRSSQAPRTQAAGPVELAARPPRPDSAEGMPASASMLHAPRAPLMSLRRRAPVGDTLDSLPDAWLHEPPAVPGGSRPTGTGTLPPAAVLHEGLDSWDFIPLNQGGTASSTLRAPGSPGAESSSSEDSSQAFLSARASMRWDTNVSAVSASGRVEAAAVPAAGASPPEPEPVTRVAQLRNVLAGSLELVPFSAEALRDEPAQRAMQERYLDRAAVIAERRERAFGTVQPYRPLASMATQTKEGLLAAAYEGLQSFVTSAFRSPSGGAAGLSVAENEQFFPIDSALTTAVVQGALAYAAEGAMGAVNNRATLSNMPKISRNNFEGLFYEQGVQADTVLLVVKDGAKEFMRADDPKAPAAASLAEQASRRLSAIKLRQDLLDGKSFSVILSPLLSGGFNTLRRFVSSPATLRRPAPVFLTSALASGAASGVTKLALEIGKTRAQVRVDDLVGGQQDLNLFRLSRPNPDAEPARWTDVRGMPRVLAESAWESLALAGEAARTFGHSAADMTYRYMLVNGIANISGIGAGGMMGQLFRKGRHFGASFDESPHSRGSIAGQMTQSTFGDLIWRVLKDGMKGRDGDANVSLGLRRASRMDEQLKQAQREQDNLRTLVSSLPADSALWVAAPLTAPAEGAGDIESHGSLRSRLQQQGPMDLQTLQALQQQLTALDLRAAGDAARTDRDALVRQLGQVMQPLKSRADMQQWLRPRE